MGTICSASASRVVKEVVSRLGRIDKVVCNVGGGSSSDRLGENIDEWHRMFVNFWSTVNTVLNCWTVADYRINSLPPLFAEPNI